jgi:pantothenate kinase
MVKYSRDRLAAACDFRIVDLESDRLTEWILERQLPFDSLYFYGSDSRFKVLRE